MEEGLGARAARLITERGWHQGSLEGPDGALCPVAAIQVGCHGVPAVYCPECGPMVSQIQAAVGTPSRPMGIGDWNDRPGRTVGDVMLLLKHADAGDLAAWRSSYGPDAIGA